MISHNSKKIGLMAGYSVFLLIYVELLACYNRRPFVG